MNAHRIASNALPAEQQLVGKAAAEPAQEAAGHAEQCGPVRTAAELFGELCPCIRPGTFA